MKRIRSILLLSTLMLSLSSCGLLHKVQQVFKPKYGCPSNGKNVGAEKIISGDPQAMKDVKKAKKFKS